MPAVRSTLVRSCCLAVLLACGCSVVRVEPGPGPSLAAAVRATLPGDAGLSTRTTQELYRRDLHRLYPDSIHELAARLHAAAVENPQPELLFALAEVNHLRGRFLEKDNDPRATLCYFRSAGYAYHYLFGESGVSAVPAAAFDPRFRVACDLYNTALARCIMLAMHHRQMDARGQWHLPGRDDQDAPARLNVAHVGFAWKPEEFGTLTLCSALTVTKLGAMQKTYGLGVPMVGQRRADIPVQPFVPAGVTFPVTAFCRFDGSLADLTEQPKARLELIDPLNHTAVTIDGRAVPLETDLTTPLACFLGQTHYEKAGYLSFFRPDIVGDHGGLYFLEPYQPGKIPVVLVHGLLSSPQTWAPVINELMADPVIRQHFRFGVFFFPTGEPYLATAADLRRDLAKYRQAVDPEGKDAALNESVLAGHSMGGLIARLLTMDGGDDFFATASPVPMNSLKLTPPVQQEMLRLYFFRRDPGVRRVVFFGTPHRGSDLSPSMLGRLAAQIAGVPKQLMQTTHQVMQLNPHLGSAKCKFHTSIELLAPQSSPLRLMQERPCPAGVKYHSVIGVALSKSLFVESWFGGDGQAGDGVVPYSSAHLDGAASELLVQSDHYHIHHHPLAIREFRRILHEQLQEMPKRGP